MKETLDEASLHELSNISFTRKFPKNSIIITEGDQSDTFFVVLSGRVKVFLMNDDGKEVILNFHGQNEYFGEIAMLDDQPRSASVMAIEPSQFAIISKAEFWNCIKQNPDIALRLINKLSLRLRELTEIVKDMALMDVYGRLEKLLSSMSEPVENSTERLIKQPLTQQDLANIIGSSREMVTRIMKDMVSGGYIESKNKQIRIKKKLPPAW